MSDYNFNKIEGESDLLQLIRISVDKLNDLHKASWEEIYAMFELDYSCYTLRRYAPAWKILIDNRDAEGINEILEGQKYKESFEIKADGTQTSDKLIAINGAQDKTPEFMLKAHGFDSNEWELVNSRNNIWNTNDKKKGVQVLYSSKITVRPKKDTFTLEDLKDIILSDVKPEPVEISSAVSLSAKARQPKLLELPLYDMHWGIADLDYYKPTLERIVRKITQGNYTTVFLIIGQDALHNDNFKGQTSNGTNIDKVKLDKAYKEARMFYKTIIDEGLKSGAKVVVSYSGGNHDETIGWALVQNLMALCPQADFDDSLKSKKAFIWHKIFIGYCHGDKGASRIIEAFQDEYNNELLASSVKEIHSGHLHREQVIDKFGILHRTLATKAKTDQWHYDLNFVGAEKRFQLFEYSKDSLDGITYV